MNKGSWLVVALAATLGIGSTARVVAQIPGADGLRSLDVALIDEHGSAVESLDPRDLVVLEDGVAREVSRVERDPRPLALLLLVDTSADLGSALRLNVVSAVQDFLRDLPGGTRVALWRTGERPERLAEFTSDARMLGSALARSFPRGGNTLFDALTEATPTLRALEGQRTALIVLTGYTIELSNRSRFQAVEAARGSAEVFGAVAFDEGQADFESRAAYDYVLGTLARASGGLFERPLSSMAAGSALRKLGADLAGRFRVTYLGEPSHVARRLEVQVARPGVRARLVAAQERGK